jgi:stringent starvation protein B
MQSTKPYLIRAIHEWCADQGFTPYLAVAVDATTRVPREFVKDGEIVLNVGHDATHQLSLGNDEITFQARFGGRPYPVVVPIDRVQAIYARENGQGMAFEIVEEGAQEAVSEDVRQKLSVLPGTETGEADTPTDTDDRPPSGRPHLTRIK